MKKELQVVVCIGVILGVIMVAHYMRTSSVSVASNNDVSTISQQEKSILTAHLEMGVSELFVRDIKKQREFYESLVGLSTLDEDEETVTLGYRARPVIRLVQDSSLPKPLATSAGLYHTAIVFESRSTLAQALERVLRSAPSTYQGSADHLVSEAFYFVDPEGNGLELYFDKPASSWRWQDGEVAMDSIYIDVNQYIQQHAAISASPVNKMGHLHLKVGSIAEAKKFYVDVLGFRVTSERPTALFVSDGQYHHHLGMNVWESAGATARTPSLGLKSVAMSVASEDDIARLKERLDGANISYTDQDAEVVLLDPWKNELRFSVHTE